MHCASCELLIEDKILQYPGISAVDASISNGTIRIEYKQSLPRISDLNSSFKKDGYVFSEEKIAHAKEPLLYFEEGKGIQVDKKLLRKKWKTTKKVLVVFLVLYFLERSGVAGYVGVSESSSLGVFLLFGIVAGLSSCAALVGGILLSLMKGWHERYGYDAPLSKKMVPHLYFHGGRLFGYLLLGGALGYVGKTAAFDNVAMYAAITIIVSLVMFVVGMQMVGVRWAERFQIRMPKFITRKVAGVKGAAQSEVPFLIGAGTIFLPCGFTLIAQGVALTSGSLIRGALIMGMFVLGTMLPLLLIGYLGAQGSKSAKRGKIFSFYAGVVLVIFALYNINAQFNVLGYPSVTDLFARGGGTEVSTAVVDNNGQQIVSLIARDFDYVLSGPSTIKAGVSTKLVVDNQGVFGCAAFMASRGLIDGFVPLQRGENVIDLGKPRKGTYKITCSMGMVRPVTLRVK